MSREQNRPEPVVRALHAYEARAIRSTRGRVLNHNTCMADAIDAALSQPQAASTQALRNAYEGAREDLLDWKGRALRAESTLRSLGYTGITPDIPPAVAASSTQAGEVNAAASNLNIAARYARPEHKQMIVDAIGLIRRLASSTTPGSTGAGEWGSAAGVVDFWKSDPFEAAMAASSTTPAVAASSTQAAEKALRDALAYVGQRTDGDLQTIAERAELWMRESKCLINEQADDIAASSTTPGSTGAGDDRHLWQADRDVPGALYCPRCDCTRRPAPGSTFADWTGCVPATRAPGVDALPAKWRQRAETMFSAYAEELWRCARELEAALAQPAQQGSLPEITEEAIVALVAGPYNWHHKMTEREEAEAKGFDRCRENTIGRIRVFFETRRAMQAGQPAQQGERGESDA